MVKNSKCKNQNAKWKIKIQKEFKKSLHFTLHFDFWLLNFELFGVFIKFKTGREYIYHEVPRDEFEALISADSVGKYFLEEIKDDYDFTNLGDDTEQFCDEDDTESEDEE